MDSPWATILKQGDVEYEKQRKKIEQEDIAKAENEANIQKLNCTSMIRGLASQIAEAKPEISFDSVHLEKCNSWINESQILIQHGVTIKIQKKLFGVNTALWNPPTKTLRFCYTDILDDEYVWE